MPGSYSNTAAFGRNIVGIPFTTFSATCIAIILYIAVVIEMLTLNCPLQDLAMHFFIFTMMCIVALCTMAGINMMYNKYHFNCLSLTVSLFYSGSAMLIMYGLILSSFNGLCMPDGVQKGSIFGAGHVGNYVVWFTALTALAFQIVAHYFYG